MPTNDVKPIWPSRGWWAALIVIVLVAGALRYTGYNFSLPYIDHPDEPAYNLAGRMIIDFGSAKPLGMQGYPPGIVTINYFFLRFFQDPMTPPGTILWIVRLISITFSLGVVVMMGLLGYRVMTPLAGLLAAGIWTVTPIIVEYSRYATADNFVTFFVLAAFFLTLTAVHYDRDNWTRAGLISCLLGIVFKYQAIFVLPIILALPLWRLTYSGINRRRVLKDFGSSVLIVMLFMGWLILLYPALEATSSPDFSASNERLTIPTLTIVYNNFRIIYNAFAPDWIWLVGWLGFAVLLWRQFRQQVYLLGLGVLLSGALAWLTGLSFYGNLGVQTFRQFISAGAFLTILRASGLAGWAMLLGAGMDYLPQPIIRAQSQRIAVVIVAVLIVLWTSTLINISIANAQQHTLPDHRNELAVWMDTTLTAAPYIANRDNDKVLNRSWGGYAGINQFTLVETASLRDKTIAAWRESGVTYAIMGAQDYADIAKDPGAQDYIQQTLLLKTYPLSAAYRGPDIAVLRLFPIQHAAQGTLGSVNLVGYDLDHDVVKPGDSITFTLYWKASVPPDAEYTVYNHLIPVDSRDIIAQVDGLPMPDERRPTTSWNDPDETLVSRPFTMQIPADTSPGEYRLISGFYQRDTNARLTSPDGNDYIVVATITISS